MDTQQLKMQLVRMAQSFQQAYNSLDKKDRDAFVSFHAPHKISRPQEVLVREIIPNSSSPNGRTLLSMPSRSELLAGSEYVDGNEVKKRRTRLVYKMVTLNQALNFKRNATFEDGRGLFVDHLGRVHRDIFKQSGKFYKIVEDLDGELAFVQELLAIESPKAPALAKVAKSEVEKQEKDDDDDDDTSEWEAIVQEYNENPKMWTKREFAAKHGTTTKTLNKYLKKHSKK